MNIPIRIKNAAALLAAALSYTVSAASHHAALDSPNPTAPYTDWATTAHVIQQVVDAAAAGDEIVVTNGVYATGGRAVNGTVPSRVAAVCPVVLAVSTARNSRSSRGQKRPAPHSF